jgi:hypothetical protein
MRMRREPTATVRFVDQYRSYDRHVFPEGAYVL